LRVPVGGGLEYFGLLVFRHPIGIRTDVSDHIPDRAGGRVDVDSLRRLLRHLVASFSPYAVSIPVGCTASPRQKRYSPVELRPGQAPEKPRLAASAPASSSPRRPFACRRPDGDGSFC